MQHLIDLAPLVAAMLATGVVGGILAGLLGVGGGIVIVPVLELAFTALHVDPSIRMQMAAATSLATIIPTSISSARAHRRRGAIDHDLIRRWSIPVFLGAIMGVVIAANVTSIVLAIVFGSVCLLVAAKMILPLEHVTVASDVPRGGAGLALPFSIGTLSTMMGIGGGTISVPTLTLLSFPIHRAVGTAALFGLIISVPGTAAFIIAGLGDPRLPQASLGFVNIAGFLLIAPATWLAAPLGARVAHALSRRHLSLAFGTFLFIVAARMFYHALTG